MADKKEYIERGALKQKKVYSVERHECVVPVAEIDWIPAADVVEVRHGHWIIKTDEYGNEYMMCSYCEDEFYPADEDTVDSTPNYCPNCGARMDGERKEQT